MKRSADHKAARAILETILREIDTLPEEAAAQVAIMALETFQEAGGAINPGAIPFIIGPKMGAPDPGRPAPANLTILDLLKDPADGPKVEEVIREHVKRPPDLAALVEAMSRLKMLTQEAANGAAVVRVAQALIGAERAGTDKKLRDNRGRATTRAGQEEGKIARKIDNFIKILTQ